MAAVVDKVVVVVAQEAVVVLQEVARSPVPPTSLHR
jgi:hypothetical protein